jgi:hypothetical protein
MHSIVGLAVWSGSSFLCFGNFISLTAVLPMFQLLRLVRSLAVLLVTIVNYENLFQPDTLFLLTGKKSFSVRLSELAS